MCKVLVFSKNRPMQLHAYLESLFIRWDYADSCYSNISVLYHNDPPYDYEQVISAFPNVNWIPETNFNGQLRELIQNCSDEFIMFGCDDVIFVRPFSLNLAELILRENQSIFGFSLRLGQNIQGFPEDIVEDNFFYHWDWKAFELDDFHYPWELDCTVYRTSDVKDMINKYQKPFINPNYFEEFVTFDWDYYIKRPRLACFEISKALVLTINRVQNTHPNYFDDNCPSLEQLNNMYQQGFIIDIDMPYNNKIHVGSNYLRIIKWAENGGKGQRELKMGENK